MNDWTSDCGRVRLICGDCRDWFPKLDSIDAVIMDPPYGCNVNYGDSYNDNRKDYWTWFRERLDGSLKCCPLLAFTHRNHALKHITDWDWVGVWNKPGSFGARIGNSMILPHWEPIFFYGIHRKGVKTEYLPDVLTFNPERANASHNGIGREKWSKNGNGNHPCPKPIGLITMLVKSLSKEQETVLDPFTGSGTTAIACLKSNRRFIGIEINPDYFQIAKERVQNELSQLTFPFEHKEVSTQTLLV